MAIPRRYWSRNRVSRTGVPKQSLGTRGSEDRWTFSGDMRMRWVSWLSCVVGFLLGVTLVCIGNIPVLTAQKAARADREDPPPVASRGARLYTAEGPPIDNAVLIVRGGKITAF